MQRHTAEPSVTDLRDDENIQQPMSTQTESTDSDRCGSRGVTVHLTTGWCGEDEPKIKKKGKKDYVMTKTFLSSSVQVGFIFIWYI